jgi:hypothetical protein
VVLFASQFRACKVYQKSSHYFSICSGTAVTINDVEVYVNVTNSPEMVLVSVIGQRDVEVAKTMSVALAVTGGNVVLAPLVQALREVKRENSLRIDGSGYNSLYH